jgi:hypothetical protein
MDINEITKGANAANELMKTLNKHNDWVAKIIPPSIENSYGSAIKLPTNPNLASEFYKRLVEWINNFDKSLDETEEVGVRLVNFGQALTFHLQDMSYYNPSLISFQGTTDNGEPVELIQHVSQISILLQKVKRKDLTTPKKPIGFIQSDEE